MTMRARMLLGAVLLLALGLAAEWTLREPAAEAPEAASAPAAAAPAPATSAEASTAAAAPVSTATASAAEPAQGEESAKEVPEENDPIEPELPQTPEWKLEKTAHLSQLMDRHVVRLEAERADAEAAGKPEEAKRLEVAVARAQRRLESLKAEMASLQAQTGAVAAQ